MELMVPQVAAPPGIELGSSGWAVRAAGLAAEKSRPPFLRRKDRGAISRLL